VALFLLIIKYGSRPLLTADASSLFIYPPIFSLFDLCNIARGHLSNSWALSIERLRWRMTLQDLVRQRWSGKASGMHAARLAATTTSDLTTTTTACSCALQLYSSSRSLRSFIDCSLASSTMRASFAFSSRRRSPRVRRVAPSLHQIDADNERFSPVSR